MPSFIVDHIAHNQVTLRVNGYNYAHTFAIAGNLPPALASGARVQGAIHAPAWKVDRVELGGNYVEPLSGRPRRMQGTILSVNPAANELTVQVGYQAIVKLPPKYQASDFKIGERIGWDNLDIPTFHPDPAAAANGL